ncbi:Stp1/IreP family PP2C-type Ser/Thr phosphatase [Thermophilibacter immobilis]|nr:Stp1/IreP family PP2C-type Ser/Thr phosphatase [Thermophilibacter immobilis]
MSTDQIQTLRATGPANAPGRAEMTVEGRMGADAISGSNEFLSWGTRSDVGLVRSHNEDSFLLRTPLFVVCDGMGGHAAGEVASSIAVETIGEQAPGTADDVLLGAAVEAANLAVIKGAEDGVGKPGMGCTATAVLISKNKMAVAHVGDSRAYMLHHGTLVRITHDHSYVEELVDSGQITADEARTHPSRSIITRALGSDPDMYADHFSLEVSDGDRVILCSDGLSSMIPDSDIEAVAVSSATPQQAADNLVGAALTAGGSDNVTALVVDILNDGVADATRSQLTKRIFAIAGILLATVAVCLAGVLFFIRNEWYLGVSDGNVAVYQGVNADLLGLPLYDLVSTSAVATSDLPTSVQDQLEAGIRVQNQESAQQTLDSYSQQISDEKSRAQEVAVEARSGSDPTVETATPTDTTTSDQSEGD